jgi:excisionase family DNA binding protein
MPTESKRREFISVQQVCADKNVSPRTVYRYISQGILKPYRIGTKLIRFDVEEVERAFTAQR